MVRITNTPRGNACFHYYNRASRPWSGVRFNHQRETTLLCFELSEREITQTLVRWSNTSDKNSIIIIIPQHMKVSIQNVSSVSQTAVLKQTNRLTMMMMMMMHALELLSLGYRSVCGGFSRSAVHRMGKLMTKQTFTITFFFLQNGMNVWAKHIHLN